MWVAQLGGQERRRDEDVGFILWLPETRKYEKMHELFILALFSRKYEENRPIFHIYEFFFCFYDKYLLFFINYLFFHKYLFGLHLFYFFCILKLEMNNFIHFDEEFYPEALTIYIETANSFFI